MIWSTPAGDLVLTSTPSLPAAATTTKFAAFISKILASTNEEYLSRINLDNKELVLNHEILPQNIVLNLLRDDLLS